MRLLDTTLFVDFRGVHCEAPPVLLRYDPTFRLPLSSADEMILESAGRDARVAHFRKMLRDVGRDNFEHVFGARLETHPDERPA